MKLEEYLNNIERKLERSFDIERDFKYNDQNFDMFAKFYSKTERYIITKGTVIDTIETNEYCFLKYYTRIDEYEIEKLTDLLIEAIDTMINFDDGHMSSIMTGVIILDNKPSEDLIEIIKKYKYHKGFAFGFKGWVDVRLVLVTMNQNYIVANKKGKEVLDLYSTEFKD